VSRYLNKIYAAVAVGLATVVIFPCAYGGDDPAFPRLGDGWVRMQFQDSPHENTWSYRVFRNVKSGDLLSFGLRPVSPKEPADLSKWADTAQEIFPGGIPIWANPQSLSVSSDMLRAEVGDFASVGKNVPKEIPIQALAYVQVVEVPGGDNRMVQGKLFLLSGFVLIVQHTAFKPITDDLVSSVAVPLVTESRGLQEVFSK